MWSNTIMLNKFKVEEDGCISHFFFIHLHKVKYKIIMQ